MGKEDTKTEIILAQWQTCVEMANSISQRRDMMNNIFVTLNLAILASMSFAWDFKSIFILIAGIVVCILWCSFIKNFKLLNSEKFSVINELEKKLPTKPYSDEWRGLQKSRKYKDGTTLEKILPHMFIIMYLTSICVIIVTKIIGEGGAA